jgi:nucleoid DNA-binding protein
MTLKELVATLAVEHKIDGGTAKKLAEGLFASIKKTVEEGASVNIPGLGTFVLKERPAGEVTAAKTGLSREVAAARYVTLRPTRAALGKPAKAPKSAAKDKPVV